MKSDMLSLSVLNLCGDLYIQVQLTRNPLPLRNAFQISTTIFDMSFKSNVEQNGLEETRKAYMLPHNRKEIERMKIQHEWIKGSFGGLIKAPIDYNKKNQRILDSATADGSDTIAY
jgi:hypothetical protein